MNGIVYIRSPFDRLRANGHDSSINSIVSTYFLRGFDFLREKIQRGQLLRQFGGTSGLLPFIRPSIPPLCPDPFHPAIFLELVAERISISDGTPGRSLIDDDVSRRDWDRMVDHALLYRLHEGRSSLQPVLRVPLSFFHRYAASGSCR